MKILMVNKFLYPSGGSETYMLRLGRYLQSRGHEVEYFGMAHEGRVVGNSAGCYVAETDYRSRAVRTPLLFLKTIYSPEARRKMGIVLDRFRPDVVHLNNINFQLTPSIYYAVKQRGIPMVQTIHDPQIGCPCHRLFIEHAQRVCTECLGGKYSRCVINRCVSGSRLKSLAAALESWYYHRRNAYGLVDRYICPSDFMAGILRRSGVDASRLETLRNFPTMEPAPGPAAEKKNYVLYFGRYSVEKGLLTLIEACRRLSEILFVFAGAGPMEGALRGLPNLKDVGFRSGDALQTLIAQAAFSVYPSVWYENCPMSVLESQMLGTPVVGADIGGIPELIIPGVTGELFESGSADALAGVISGLYRDRKRLRAMQDGCRTHMSEAGMSQYYARLMDIYQHAGVRRVCS